jgi:hypothetical protein
MDGGGEGGGERGGGRKKKNSTRAPPPRRPRRLPPASCGRLAPTPRFTSHAHARQGCPTPAPGGRVGMEARWSVRRTHALSALPMAKEAAHTARRFFFSLSLSIPPLTSVSSWTSISTPGSPAVARGDLAAAIVVGVVVCVACAEREAATMDAPPASAGARRQRVPSTRTLGDACPSSGARVACPAAGQWGTRARAAADRGERGEARALQTPRTQKKKRLRAQTCSLSPFFSLRTPLFFFSCAAVIATPADRRSHNHLSFRPLPGGPTVPLARANAARVTGPVASLPSSASAKRLERAAPPISSLAAHQRPLPSTTHAPTHTSCPPWPSWRRRPPTRARSSPSSRWRWPRAARARCRRARTWLSATACSTGCRAGVRMDGWRGVGGEWLAACWCAEGNAW